MQTPTKLKVLVVGIQNPENQFVRAIESYGMEPIHFSPNEGRRTLPLDADVAICVTSFTSHKDFWAVKDQYKQMGKRIFIATHGFSEIKEEFERFFFSDLKKTLEGMNWTDRLHYVLGRFFRPGQKFRRSELEVRMHRFYANLTPVQMSNFLTVAQKQGTLDKTDKRGHFIFRGLAACRVKYMANHYQIQIPSEWQPAVVLPPAPVTVQAIEKVADKPVDTVTLLLDVISELDKKVNALTEKLNAVLGVYNPSLFRVEVPQVPSRPS